MGVGPTLDNRDLWLGDKELSSFERALLGKVIPVGWTSYNKIHVSDHTIPFPLFEISTTLKYISLCW